MTHTKRLLSAPTGFPVRPRRPARQAFTLPEMLVVIVILGVLVGLVGGAVQRVRRTMHDKAAADTVAKIQGGVDDQIKAINDRVAKDQRERASDYTALLAYCDGDQDRAAALLTYCRLRQYVLITPGDVSTPAFTVGGVTFNRPAAVMSQINGLTGNAHYVSAAILHASLTKRSLGSVTLEADTGLSGAQGDIGPPDLSVAKRAFRDSWNRPVAFALVTESQLPELGTDPKYTNPNAPVGRRDPFDPQGKLAGWADTAKKNAAESALGVTFDGTSRWPLVYSLGSNSQFNNYGGDDIVGHRVKISGGRVTQ